MNTIKLNNFECEVESYNKTTSFSGDTISSTGYCSIYTNNIDGLNTLAQAPITAIQIHHNDNLIYDLQDITAHVDNINEYLSGDHMSINVNLIFDN